MTRHRQQRTADWLWEEFDRNQREGRYRPERDPGKPEYQTKYTGNDFRVIARKEKEEFPGQITRYDVSRMDDGSVRISEYRAGWLPWSRPDRSRPAEHGRTLEQIIEWLQGQGWQVRQWPNGARAWRVRPRTVRTRSQYEKHRAQLMNRPELLGIVHTLDMALDT